MTSAQIETTAADRLVTFIKKLLPADIAAGFGPQSPLLELGVLDSLKAARLLNFISKELNTTVPTHMIDTTNFRDVGTITAMIATLNGTSQRD